MNTEQIQRKRQREKKIVSLMIRLYCNKNHGTKHGNLCEECSALTDYAYDRAERCPHMAEKTFCSACKTHCYRPEMRERIRRVMRYSGPRMIFYYPSTAIKHSFTQRTNSQK